MSHDVLSHVMSIFQDVLSHVLSISQDVLSHVMSTTERIGGLRIWYMYEN